MIVLHERIHTMIGSGWGTVAAFRCSQGRVVQVGTRADVLASRSPGEEVVELPPGGCVVPGFIDSHCHLTSLGLRPGALNLPDEATPEQWTAAIRERAQMLPRRTWITGRAWNHEVWPNSHGFPTHDPLTDAAPHHPVVLQRTDCHAVWCNRAALDAAGIQASTPDPQGGRIVRDARGEPTGVLIDDASDLVADVMPDIADAEVEAGITATAGEFLAHGITTVHCALVRPGEIGCYDRVFARQTPVPLKVRGMIWAEPDELIVWAEQHEPADRGPNWRYSTLKAFADGALGSRGAWFLEPYEGHPGECGLPVTTPEKLLDLATVAAQRGFQLATHAIGDRAVRETLRAYQTVEREHPGTIRDLRFRIEHLQHTTEEDLTLAASLGVLAAMQPIHCTRDMRFARRLIGSERSRLAYAWQAARSAGIPIAFGSDYPIETMDVRQGLYAAVTRRTAEESPAWHPEQCVDRLAAVRGWTIDAAAFVAGDDHLGHLGVGASADFVVLSEDLATCPDRSVLETEILQVWVEGTPQVTARPY